MALSWNIDTEESIEFKDFIHYLKGFGPRVLERDFDETALMMRRLANNRAFLTDKLNEELCRIKNLKNFQSTNLYTPQVFMLHAEDDFFIRVNIWEPLQNRPGESLFFYESSHDHNFTFMTVGYYGSGYRTQIYEYDVTKVIGYVNEPVDLRFLEDTTLPAGKVMLFRESVDIHTQLPPQEMSLSVNIMKRAPNVPGRLDQYLFDHQKGVCLGKAGKHSEGLLVRLAGVVGNDDTLSILSDIASSHECRRTRLAAYETLAKRRGDEVWARAIEDWSALVRKVAETKLIKTQNAA